MNWMRECREVEAEGDWDALSLDAGSQRAFVETDVCGMTGMGDPVPEEVLTATQVYSEHLFNFFIEGYQPSGYVNTILVTYGALVEQSLMGMTAARCLRRTEQGRLGQGRSEAREGDLFCVI